jgi:hypothetical protein
MTASVAFVHELVAASADVEVASGRSAAPSALSGVAAVAVDDGDRDDVSRLCENVSACIGGFGVPLGLSNPSGARRLRRAHQRSAPIVAVTT